MTPNKFTRRASSSDRNYVKNIPAHTNCSTREVTWCALFVHTLCLVLFNSYDMGLIELPDTKTHCVYSYIALYFVLHGVRSLRQVVFICEFGASKKAFQI